MLNRSVGLADELASKLTVIRQQGCDDAFGAIEPAPHDVVPAPEWIEKSAEVAEGTACKFMPTGLTFIDQRGGILRTDANDVYLCRFSDIRPVNDWENDPIVFVVILIVIAEVFMALHGSIRGFSFSGGSFILQAQRLAAHVIGFFLCGTDLILQGRRDVIEQREDFRIREQLSGSNVALILDSSAAGYGCT